MSSYRHPEFLNTPDEPTSRVRCPIHGFIRFSENERRIIDHRLFRRLRYVRQLALTELVYPGASHTRFEHSLGVMEVATRAFDALAAKHGDLMESTFGGVAGFHDRPMARARQYLRLAALLHDVGHASFSHAAEKIVHKDSGHEQLSLKIIKEAGLMGEEVAVRYGSDAATFVAQIVEGGKDLPPQLQILHDLVSGEMDADRTDYLLRDSHHCGVDYGRFDYRRMIESLELQEGDFSALEIALNRDGIHTFEALILARYQMNTQVYYHHLRRLYDQYLEKYHQAVEAEVPFTPEGILANNDVTMMAQIMHDAEAGAGERHKWAKRIAERTHHRVVYDTGVNAKAEDLRRARKLLPWLQGQYPGCEFLADEANINIHKLLTPDDQEDTGLVRLPLVGMSGPERYVGFVSQVLSKIPRKSYCARIFVDLPRDEQARLQEIKTAIRGWQG